MKLPFIRCASLLKQCSIEFEFNGSKTFPLNKMKVATISTIFLVVLHQVFCVSSSTRSEKEQKILESILNPKTYKPSIRPRGINGSSPVIVRINMYIRGVYKVDDLNMEYAVQVTFRQRWKDEMLSYVNHTELTPEVKYLSIRDPSIVWVPDVFFSNEKEGHFHNIVTPNVLLRIFPNGQVLYSSRLSLKLSCPMDLKYYPMDKQTCSIILASYGYTTADVVFIWKEGDPVQITRNLYAQHFVIEQFISDYCTSKTNTGEYSCLRLDFLFKREFQRYFLEIYMPSLIFVMLSWLCFWLDHKATTARICIWMTLFLAFSIKLSFLSNKTPSVDYNTAYDTWVITCMLFLVAVILEIVVVTIALSRESGNHGTDAPADNDSIKKRNSSEDEPEEQRNTAFRLYHILLRKCPSLAQKIDAVCRIVFPAAFALFNLFYWCCTVQRYD